MNGAGRGDSPRPLWWLHPRVAALFLGVPLLVGAWLVPESSYATLYRTDKHVDLGFVVLGLIVFAAFVTGSSFAVGKRSTRDGAARDRDVLLYCRFFVWPLFVFTVFGYAVWFGYAVVTAGPGQIATSVVGAVQGTEESYDYLKKELFQTLPGITTFTQFGIMYATVEALLWVRGGSDRRAAAARFAVVLILTLLRALLLSERLALLEIVVPVAVVLVSRADLRPAYRPLMRLAPLLMAPAVFALFAFAEYFRSWSFYRDSYAGTYLGFAAERFLGYYATAVNNGAVLYYYEVPQPFRATLDSLFDFPGLGVLVQGLYEKAYDAEVLGTRSLLEIYANPEFNNVALVGRLLNEWSWSLAPVAAFLLGLLSATLYRSFGSGRLVGLLLYPSWFVGLLEISRIYYWPGQRYFPTLVFLLASLIFFGMAKVPAESAIPGAGAERGAPRRASRNARWGGESLGR